MKFRTFVHFVCIIVTVDVMSASTDYYWKDYTGDIPQDAFVVGKTPDGKNAYVGQAYRENKGILPVQIYPGHKEVYTFTERKVVKTERGIKILCGPSSIFEWLTTTNGNFNVDVLDKHLVVGGFQTNNYFIGRSTHLGELKVGKIDPSPVSFYFHHSGQELDSPNYQVLVAKKRLDIDIRNKIL